MAITNNNTARTITNLNDGNDSFNAVNVETTELEKGGVLISETTEIVEDNSTVGGPSGSIVTRVFSDDVKTRTVNGEVRAVITNI